MAMGLRHAFAAGLALSSAVLMPGAAAAADQTVLMDGGHFVPPWIEIAVGDTVTWTNRDALLHDAAGDGWTTEQLVDDESDSVTFSTAGSYPYVCTIHPSMTGTVVVRAAGSGAAPTPPPGDAARVAAVEAPTGGGLAIVLTVAGFGLVIGLRRTAARR